MHLIVRESRELDEQAVAQDLALEPADIVFLSFSDSDLSAAVNSLNQCPEAHRPSLRAVNLALLRHPMSVDLFAEKTLPGTKAVVVRLLGGLDYWRYGAEQLGRICRDRGIALAIVPGDFRPDMRLAALSTVSAGDLEAIENLLDAGGTHNTRWALAGFLNRALGSAVPFQPLTAVAEFGIYTSPAIATGPLGRAAIVFYRSHFLSGDVMPVDHLARALEARGLATTALYVASLKAPEAARWLQAGMAEINPSVILNATAFAARDGNGGSPFDAADCPVLQVALAGLPRAVWESDRRGLNAADLAMHVVLPELDGRLFAGTISFKEAMGSGLTGGGDPVRHVPLDDGIVHVADLACAWARLRTTSPSHRKAGLILSTYPGRPDQIAHAVGLDALQSSIGIANHLAKVGYTVEGVPGTPQELTDRLSYQHALRWPLSRYTALFATLPHAFQQSVTDAWGAPQDDPGAVNGAFDFHATQLGNLTICLQPERGSVADRKAQYHDPATPPRHAYVAFYLWLRHDLEVDALVHLGAHGTLEWLPGKAVALSNSCAPQAVLGPMPLIYPFIVNDPGEAAQAKRRVCALTLGHRPPPLVGTELPEAMLDVERLTDEFSAADGLDTRRRKALAAQIIDAATRAGIAETCGLVAGMTEADALVRIDAFLCDVKELSIRDGLHVLDPIELDAITRALDGRFIEPGPAGAPSRGRADVLPTGRNLYSVDPRAIPTPTAWTNGQRAATAILDRYVSDYGDWPRAIVLDLWGSATLRTGGEELATALALLGVRPTWDTRSFRVTGVETNPIAVLARPRVDVTLRISGLFRDMFATQLSLFDSAVHLVASLKEDASDNPLVGQSQSSIDRIFGPASGTFGAGVMARIDQGDWSHSDELGRSYLEASSQAYRGDGSAREAGEAFETRVRDTDAFVHMQDHREIDLLTGGDFAAHEGGFAAAAKATGNTRVALYHGDTGEPDAPRVRTLDEECARIVHGRAASPRWIEGQMRHGFRGAAEMASTVDAAFAFAATARAVDSGAFERLYAAYLGDPAVAAFVERENPAALEAMRRRFDDAVARGLWQPRRNDVFAQPASEPVSTPQSREAAE
ncbi:MAG: cobaltochelatase subunit CobN [Hyphomicrobium sp.]